MTENIYLRLDDDGDGVDCSSVGFAPNQLNKRPIGVACNERLSTVFATLFCIVGVRAVAWAIITKFHDTIAQKQTRIIYYDLPANGKAMPIKKIKTVPNILTTTKAAPRTSKSTTIGRSCKTVGNAIF